MQYFVVGGIEPSTSISVRQMVYLWAIVTGLSLYKFNPHFLACPWEIWTGSYDSLGLSLLSSFFSVFSFLSFVPLVCLCPSQLHSVSRHQLPEGVDQPYEEDHSDCWGPRCPLWTVESPEWDWCGKMERINVLACREVVILKLSPGLHLFQGT